jgi:hypothetical protein
LSPFPRFNDAAAYLLQARIFGSFHWSAPTPPLPEFFEQYNVFVSPVFASKYAPGHSLLLVPGIWLGLPALVPVLLTGVSGAFVFLLSRRISTAWVALLTWMLWSTGLGMLPFLPSYLSQATTCALWLMGWWALLRWRNGSGRKWIVLLAATIGWGAITQPYPWFLYAIPVGAVVLPRAIRQRAWSDLAGAMVIGGTCLVILGIWNQRITGSPLRVTWIEYTRDYFPSDALGFGASEARPRRQLPADWQQFGDTLHAAHAQYTPRHLPSALARRLATLAADSWRPNRYLLAPLFLIGVVSASPELLFALVTCVVVVGGYLMYASEPVSSLYYVQLQPVFAYVTALGLWRMLLCMGRSRDETRHKMTGATGHWGAAFGILVFAVAMLPEMRAGMIQVRDVYARYQDKLVAFHVAADSLPGRKLVVFVRYGPWHDPSKSLVMNDPDLTHARIWTVHDRGADDLRLIRLVPDRVAYLFDDASGSFTRIDTTGLDQAWRLAAP